MDLEVSDFEAPEFDLEADFDVPDSIDFNVSDVQDAPSPCVPCHNHTLEY